MIKDSEIVFVDDRSIKHYPYKMRLIRFKDPETGREFEFITNNFKLSALTIAKLYKKKWSELSEPTTIIALSFKP